MKYPIILIEVALPLDDINEAAVRKKYKKIRKIRDRLIFVADFPATPAQTQKQPSAPY